MTIAELNPQAKKDASVLYIGRADFWPLCTITFADVPSRVESKLHVTGKPWEPGCRR